MVGGLTECMPTLPGWWHRQSWIMIPEEPDQFLNGLWIAGTPRDGGYLNRETERLDLAGWRRHDRGVRVFVGFAPWGLGR